MFDLQTIGAGLPVAETIGSLPTTGHIVVQAPPGTGKTTLVPPALSNQVDGKVIVTAPRRVAVRAAAHRLAELSGTPEQVGYAIRGESKKGSRVEFVTPGVLLRRLLKDPELEGVSAVALDEVHERQLDTDLVLAMCVELATLREDFRVVAMSATVDAERFARLLGTAPIHTTEAVTYPVETSYAPLTGRAAGTREFYQEVARTAKAAHQKNPGSTLVFVPGLREVNQVADALLAHHETNVYPLHGQQTTAEQDAALYTDEERIVVATSIAESSLTVPSVRTVVDAGLSRVPRRDAQRGMSGLVTVSTSKSSADQRAGRAGREAPGHVVRCYSAEDYQHFSPHITPEILSADLTQAALFMDAWGAGPDFPLLDPPPKAALADAHRTLEALGARSAGAVTPLGEKLAVLPADPRLGAALLKLGRRAAPTVAIVSNDARGDIGKLSGSEWLAIAEVSLSNAGNAIVRAAARIEEAEALDAIGITEEVVAQLDGGKVRGRKVKRAGAIELSSTPVKVTGQAAADALAAGIIVDDFHFSEKAQLLRDRLRHLHDFYGEPWPDLEAQDLAVWLAPELRKIADGTPIAKVDMYPALQRLLPWPEATHLDELAPERLAVPSGRDARIDWTGERPIVHIKLQECFGLAESPEYCGHRVQFHLLSPAGRPLAVTDDLASFWAGPYQGVRSEMRGRYPKHPWPEDPWTAPATARTKNRMR